MHALRFYSPLGLIDEDEHRELVLIRRIRNDLAHDPKPVFTADPRIANRCSELKYGVQGEGKPEGHFTSSAVALISSLINRGHYARQQRRTFLNWPR